MNYLKLFEGFDSICDQFNINDYSVNSDGSIDVNGDVILSGENLMRLPLRFGSHNNQLVSLKGLMKVGRIKYEDNPVYQIVQMFKSYNQFKTLLDDYNYIRGNRIIRVRFQEACIEAGIEMPKKIEGYDII